MDPVFKINGLIKCFWQTLHTIKKYLKNTIKKTILEFFEKRWSEKK